MKRKRVIAITAAMDLECGNILEKYKSSIYRKIIHKKTSFHFADTGKFKLIIVKTGIGKRAVKEAAEVLFNHNSPDILISAGLCGGAAPGIECPDIIVPEKLGHISHPGKILPSDPGLFSLFAELKSGYLNIKTGGIMLGSNKINSREDKIKLSEDCPELTAVDMESYYLADIAKDMKIKFIAARSVSDDIDYIFPKFEFVKEKLSQINKKRALKYFITRPYQLYSWLSLRINCSRAAKANASAVKRFTDML
ncbi:MAG: hypothetical protein ACLFQK_09400 [Fibrobacterota bacterium]